ncbi:MAG: HAD family hydrolase, partial [Gammaproteobacteria bacterium]
QCLQRSAKHCGRPIPSPHSAKNVIGLSIDNAVNTLFPEADEKTRERLVHYYNREYASRQIGKNDLFSGVSDMLAELKEAGYLLAVATGKTRAGLEKALKATDTQDLFCFTRCADETASKPDPKMIRDIMQYADASSERTLMVGDSVHDLQMAKNAQISAIAVACGAHPETVLQQHQPLACLQQPTDLLNFI